MKCLIVDDEEMAIKVLETYINKISSLEIVATHSNAMDAFSTLQETHIDILFLDIQMPKLTGFGLLKTLANPPHVILTTAHREYALESYEFTVTDYVLKPVSFERFLKAIEKIRYFEQKQLLPLTTANTPATASPSFFYIRSNRQFIKINLDEVLYIQSLRNHIRIVTTTSSHIALTAIGEMEEKLPPQHFMRVHRSYIVALSKIHQFTPTSVLVGEQTLPVGGYYKKELMERLEKGLI